MKYMVVGVGGTGGAVGAHLAHAGNDVTFIARGKHLEAMRKNGLKVIKPSGEFLVEQVCAYTTDEYLRLINNSNYAENEYQQGLDGTLETDDQQGLDGTLETDDRQGLDGTPETDGQRGTDGIRQVDGRSDVIFVCVKGYSIDSIVPFLAEAAGPDTVVIPILNIFGTGGRLQKDLPGIIVLDGCIYVASEISEPGCIWMNGEILRVVFGLRMDQKDCEDPVSEFGAEFRKKLEKISDDLNGAGIHGILSDNIERDAMRKFSYVSPQGACGLYYDVPVRDLQHPGEMRDCFAELVKEISDLADAMGIGFGEDAVGINLKIMDGLSPDMTTSLQRDVAAGKASEIDGLIYEVIKLGTQYGVEMPVYEKITEELRNRGLE